MVGLLVLGAAVRGALYLKRAPLATLEVPLARPDGRSAPPATLLYVFRPDDCAGYQHISDSWNRLGRRSEQLSVVGVGLDVPESRQLRSRLRGVLDVSFPVVFEPASRVEDFILRLGYSTTPVSVVVDRDGRPRMVVPPASDPEAQDAAAETVEEIAERLGGRSG